jgi:hypothetical protein
VTAEPKVNAMEEYVDAAEAVLAEAEFSAERCLFVVPAHLISALRIWHHRVTGRYIVRATP